jgi:hypothetical protein
MLTIHTLGGLLTHTTNLVVSVLNAGSAYLQNLFNHVVTGVEGVASDIRTVGEDHERDCRVHLVTTKVRVMAEIDIPELTSGRHMSCLRQHMEDALVKC